MILQKFLAYRELLCILIRRGHCCIRAGERVRMYITLDIAFILGRHQGHVAIRASHRTFRIVEGTGALPGYSAGLPVVIFVEPAHPPVMVYRTVEMHLVAGRTKLRCLR